MTQPRKKKLLDRVRNAIRTPHYSLRPVGFTHAAAGAKSLRDRPWQQVQPHSQPRMIAASGAAAGYVAASSPTAYHRTSSISLTT